MPKRKAKPETLLTAARICRGELYNGASMDASDQFCALGWQSVVVGPDLISLWHLSEFLQVDRIGGVARWNNNPRTPKSLIARKLNGYFRKHRLLGKLRAVLKRLPPGKAVRDAK